MEDTPPVGFTADRCDVLDSEGDGTPDCDVADAYVLERFLGGASSTVENVCDAYKAP